MTPRIALLLLALPVFGQPTYPYAGLWSGRRTIESHGDQLRLRFAVIDGKYAGTMIMPDGGEIRDRNLQSSPEGLSWESPNSGGGTWVYRVHLAAPDSLVGTIVLRDAPANFDPAPTGTVVMKRQKSGDARD